MMQISNGWQDLATQTKTKLTNKSRPALVHGPDHYVLRFATKSTTLVIFAVGSLSKAVTPE